MYTGMEMLSTSVLNISRFLEGSSGEFEPEG